MLFHAMCFTAFRFTKEKSSICAFVEEYMVYMQVLCVGEDHPTYQEMAHTILQHYLSENRSDWAFSHDVVTCKHAYFLDVNNVRDGEVQGPYLLTDKIPIPIRSPAKLHVLPFSQPKTPPAVAWRGFFIRRERLFLSLARYFFALWHCFARHLFLGGFLSRFALCRFARYFLLCRFLFCWHGESPPFKNFRKNFFIRMGKIFLRKKIFYIAQHETRKQNIRCV